MQSLAPHPRLEALVLLLTSVQCVWVTDITGEGRFVTASRHLQAELGT